MHVDCKTELLAPAGKWSVLREVINAGADAVYLGGKRFNMRLLRPDFNFSDQEIRDAAALCHDRGVSLYVTLNNLYYEHELAELNDYLGFLKDAQVDAVIIQDLALIGHCRRLGIAAHASVQMGVNNLETVRVLEENGCRRVILSKNLSLQEIEEIKNNSSLGLEYFVHGDLCIAHAGQCFMSGLLFAESGNRGQCRKPCRWVYDLEGKSSGVVAENKHLLACKDLCLYHAIPELIQAGVTSFKIEGRMREAQYLSLLVSTYRKAIDRYLNESRYPQSDDPEWKNLYQQRVRDFCTGSLYGSPVANDIGLSGEREPRFPTAPQELTRLGKQDYREWSGDRKQLDLSVKVDSRDGMRVALERGVQTIVVPGTLYHNQHGFSSLQEIESALKEANGAGVRVVLEFPRIITVNDRHQAEYLWELVKAGTVNEVMVHDPGSLSLASQMGIKAGAGYGLNLANSSAVNQVRKWGALWACPSLEISKNDLQSMAHASPLPLEVLVHGPLCGMISDYCLIGSIDTSEKQGCTSPCERDSFWLIDDRGQKYPLQSDDRCRCHIYHPLEMSLFTELPWLAERVSSVRIEDNGYPSDLLGQVIDIYQAALKDISRGVWNQQSQYARLLKLFPNGLTKGPH
ncbi:MAG: peptidase U32 family protein [Syntrophomonadales bacterium]|jgi:putative protease